VLSDGNHPVLGAISPLEFIEIAEDRNILKFTYYLMVDVFSIVTSWRKKFGYDLTISINVTPYLISQRSFFDDFFELLERYDLPASMIELEITEDSQIEASETTLDNMKNCQERGVRIAIDDFGTGYSLFKSLTHFPVNKIKIDRYFINRIGHDAQSEAIIRSLLIC
jgi:EAL domain-containing protein (putative c-di-GMP-specific phosphodiesterase class I)